MTWSSTKKRHQTKWRAIVLAKSENRDTTDTNAWIISILTFWKLQRVLVMNILQIDFCLTKTLSSSFTEGFTFYGLGLTPVWFRKVPWFWANCVWWANSINYGMHYAICLFRREVHKLMSSEYAFGMFTINDGIPTISYLTPSMIHWCTNALWQKIWDLQI